MEKVMTNPIVIEHIQVLEQYFEKQRELFDLLRENSGDEFEENSKRVKLMELDREINRLSERLNESIVKLSHIGYRTPSNEV